MVNMYFISDGKKIAYSDRGTGKPVILLHGYLETSAVWDDFAVRLSRRFRIITPDIPGHGLSDPPGKKLGMEEIAILTAELAAHLGIQRFFLAGHSMGGYATLAFADLFPGQLSGFCLFHSHPFADTEEIKEKRMREIGLVRKGERNTFIPGNIMKMYSDSNADGMADAIGRSLLIASDISDEGIIRVLEGMMARPARLHIMEEGKIPCLWILGTMDNYIPCDVMQARVKLPLNARLALLSKSGHMGFVEEEELSARVLSDFMEMV